jgi:hypothetical protein
MKPVSQKNFGQQSPTVSEYDHENQKNHSSDICATHTRTRVPPTPERVCHSHPNECVSFMPPGNINFY